MQDRQSISYMMERLIWVSGFLLLLQVATSTATDFTTCDRDYIKVGCYEDTQDDMDLIVNDRDDTHIAHQGIFVNWNKYQQSIHSLACRCSEKAKANGYKYFSIGYYAECWAGKHISKLRALEKDETKVSNLCVNHMYEGCTKEHEYECAGVANTQYIFEIRKNAPKDVDGGYTKWTSWSTCSTACGKGNRERERACTNPRTEGKGKDCSVKGKATEEKTCYLKPCKVTCGYQYTPYNDDGSGNMVYLDRHQLSCNSDTRGLISMFHLQRQSDHTKVRYQYKCCSLPKPGTCNTQAKSTIYNDDGDGDTVYLDRHAVDCGASGFITAFRIARSSPHGKIQYRYNCCTVSGSTPSCYWKYTSYSIDGKGKSVYLDRQVVNCINDYALSYFHLVRDSAHKHIRYRYRCCKVN